MTPKVIHFSILEVIKLSGLHSSKTISHTSAIERQAEMDPVTGVAGIVSGTIGFTRLALEASKVLLDLVNDIRKAPTEIRSVSKDIHAFYSIVFSLDIALRERDVQAVLQNDEAMVEMLGNLTVPLDSCRTVLGELMLKIQKLLKHGSKGKGLFVSSLRWSLFNKNEIKQLQVRLETLKSTFSSALDAITT